MVKKSRGLKARTRSLLRQDPEKRGKISLSKILHEYELGEKVVIKLNPTVHKGMPHRRYHGNVGTVVGKRGRAYVVDVTQGDAVRRIFVPPEHLKHLTGE